ncbi:MAG: C39 family peptidase [Caldilineales bacterium]|nr:C39 family peptidase [Caldilineales bacterium]
MRRYLFLLALFSGLILLVVFTAGSLRYGGPLGLATRVRAEISARQPNPHPILVPTPLPVDVAIIPTKLPSPSPANRPAKPTSTPVRLTAPKRIKSTASPTPSPIPTSTATPAPLHRPVQASVALEGLSHAWQTWNNCGPATLSMQLSYFGSPLTQEDIRKKLRPHPDDKNVNLDELAAYARSQGYEAAVVTNGDEETLRLLLSNGLPVLVETWLEQHPNDGMGHYRLLTGYDDQQQKWIAYDAYVSDGLKKGEPYRGISLPYDETEALWKVFNRPYLLVYEPDQWPLVASILGDFKDAGVMWLQSEREARSEIETNPDDAFAWFNLGTSLAALERYDEAAAAFDRARVIGLPWRMLWYQFGPFQAYAETGRFQEVVALADATIRTTDTVEELHYWRGKGLEGMGNIEAAQAAFTQALTLNPNFQPAADALASFNSGS